jgi:hypothetical protein
MCRNCIWGCASEVNRFCQCDIVFDDELHWIWDPVSDGMLRTKIKFLTVCIGLELLKYDDILWANCIWWTASGGVFFFNSLSGKFLETNFR